METIHFYGLNEPYECFSNFSRHPIELHGRLWPTSEHYFQAQKFVGTEFEEQVRKARRPMEAARLGRQRDWERVKDQIMREALVAKFTQHAELRVTLVGTGDARIVEHSENDSYWADGGDGNGKNMLGILLMSVREELRRVAVAPRR